MSQPANFSHVLLFPHLTVDAPGTGYTLRATAWPLNYIESNTFDVTP